MEVYVVRYDDIKQDDTGVSIHLTEKGALLLAIDWLASDFDDWYTTDEENNAALRAKSEELWKNKEDSSIMDLYIIKMWFEEQLEGASVYCNINKQAIAI